jgi:hypothetical protein
MPTHVVTSGRLTFVSCATVGGLDVEHLVSRHVHHGLLDALGFTPCRAGRQRRQTHKAWNVVGTSIDSLPDVAGEHVGSARIDRLTFLASPRDVRGLFELSNSLTRPGRGRRRRFHHGDDRGHPP